MRGGLGIPFFGWDKGGWYRKHEKLYSLASLYLKINNSRTGGWGALGHSDPEKIQSWIFGAGEKGYT